MRALLFVLIAAAFVIAPRVADACSPPVCTPASLSPNKGHTVPANLPAIVWRPSRSFDTNFDDPAMVTLATSVDPTPLPFTVTLQTDGTFLIIPTQPLVAGTTYVVTDRQTCGGTGGLEVTFTTGPAVPLPAKLGEMLGNDDELLFLDVATGSGSCSAEVMAITAGVAVVLSPEAAPWLHALHFDTLVDNIPWTPRANAVQITEPGTSWQGRGIDRIYRVCATTPQPFEVLVDDGLDAGLHDVTMTATLPGTSLQLAADTLSIELACPQFDPCTQVPMPSECMVVDESSGCSTGGSRAGWLAFALATLLVLSRLSRQERRQSRGRPRARSRTRS